MVSLVRMSDNIVNLVSCFGEKTSFRLFHNYHHPSHTSDHVGSEIISISDDFGSEGMSETSLDEKTSSFGLLDTLILNV